jgi:ankyrin repeat protein
VCVSLCVCGVSLSVPLPSLIFPHETHTLTQIASMSQAKNDVRGRNLVKVCREAGNNVIGVTKLLEAGADPDFVLGGETPLLAVLMRPADDEHAMNIAACLLAAKASPDGVEGATPLGVAAEHDNTPMSELLLQFGAQMDLPHHLYGRPIEAACRQGGFALAEVLLQRNCHPFVDPAIRITLPDTLREALRCVCFKRKKCFHCGPHLDVLFSLSFHLF